MNIGESMGYWYLRLNGFFPLSNFVIHKYDGSNSADCDLLAVRFPHAAEEIEHKLLPLDKDTFSTWPFHIDQIPIGLIVEVKMGRSLLKDSDLKSFGKPRLTYAIRRLGFWPEETISKAATHLCSEEYYCDGRYAVAKLLIAQSSTQISSNYKFKRYSLQKADKFIRERISDNIDPKAASNIFFPSDLMQYLIWRYQAISIGE